MTQRTRWAGLLWVTICGVACSTATAGTSEQIDLTGRWVGQQHKIRSDGTISEGTYELDIEHLVNGLLKYTLRAEAIDVDLLGIGTYSPETRKVLANFTADGEDQAVVFQAEVLEGGTKMSWQRVELWERGWDPQGEPAVTFASIALLERQAR